MGKVPTSFISTSNLICFKMHFPSLALLALAAAPVYGQSEKLHGVVVYSRHGDRMFHGDMKLLLCYVISDFD